MQSKHFQVIQLAKAFRDCSGELVLVKGQHLQLLQGRDACRKWTLNMTLVEVQRCKPFEFTEAFHTTLQGILLQEQDL